MEKMIQNYNEHQCPTCGSWGDYFDNTCPICKQENLQSLTMRHRWNPLRKFTMYQGEEYEYEESK